MDWGPRCVSCGSQYPDIHTGLCPNCLCRLPAVERWLVERDAITASLIRNALVENPVAVRWTEEQYQAHIRKMREPQPKEDRKAGRRPKDRIIPADSVVFELELTPSHNEFLRMHYRARRRLMDRIAGQMILQMPDASGAPYRAARVQVVRRTSRQPDPDALPAAAKPILDALQLRSKRHPYGAGVIEDDSSDHIELICTWEKAAPKHGSVLVVVTRLA